MLTSTDGLDRGILLQRDGEHKEAFLLFGTSNVQHDCENHSKCTVNECFSNPNLHMRSMGVSIVDSSMAQIIF